MQKKFQNETDPLVLLEKINTLSRTKEIFPTFVFEKFQQNQHSLMQKLVDWLNVNFGVGLINEQTRS